MVGQTARTMQGTGWLPITPLDVDLPYWLGLWFGVFPTVETHRRPGRRGGVRDRLLLRRQEIKVKRPQRRAARQGVPAPVPEPVEPAKEPVAH